jgi:hypothetical protein
MLTSQLPEGRDDALAVLESWSTHSYSPTHPSQQPRQKFYRSSEIAKNFEPQENKARPVHAGGFFFWHLIAMARDQRR